MKKLGNKKAKKILLVYTLCSSKQEAEKIARACVRSRLAACANVLAPAKSFFYWKKKLVECSERPVFMKTTEEKFGELEKKILSMHSYEVPCIVGVELSKASASYLKWVLQSVRGKK